jgi:hypothetical protein
VQWKAPDMAQLNGELTGYRLRYKLRRQGARTLVRTLGAGDTKYTIGQLSPASSYVVRIQVRVVCV